VTHPLPPRRRHLLGLGAALLAAPGVARAEIRGQIVVGKEGWLFGLWEDIRRVNLQRSRAAGAFVNQAAGEFRRGGIELVLTIAPGRWRTYEDMLPPEFQMSAEAKQRYATLLSEFRRSGALVPDLAALFAAQRRAQPEPLFFKYDTHWTGAGAEAAATEVAKAVKDRLRLPPSQRRGTQVGDFETKQNPGEFRRLMTPAEAAKVPAQEAYKVRRSQARFASAQGELVDDDANDIVIVGNSYMLPQFGFPQMFSNQLDRPVGLSLKAQRIGPYRIMLDYLGSSQFKGQPKPKVILWHFLEGSADQLPDSREWWGEAGAMAPDAFLAGLRQALAGR
jgi:hypothetical protein